jgi:hypothetical protein
MRKILFLYIIAALPTICQASAPSTLFVEDTFGNTAEFSFTDSEITVENGVMTVNGQSFNFSNVDNFYFEKAETSIESPKISPLTLFIDKADNLQITGETTLGNIEIFSITGQLLKTAQTSKNSVSIPISELEQGVYLIKTGSRTVKFIR